MLAHQLPFLERGSSTRSHTDLCRLNRWVEANMYSFALYRKQLRHSNEIWRAHQVTKLRAFGCRIKGL